MQVEADGEAARRRRAGAVGGDGQPVLAPELVAAARQEQAAAMGSGAGCNLVLRYPCHEAPGIAAGVGRFGHGLAGILPAMEALVIDLELGAATGGTRPLDDPHRIVTQVHTTRGDLVTEYDPCADPAIRQSDPVWTARITEDAR